MLNVKDLARAIDELSESDAADLHLRLLRSGRYSLESRGRIDELLRGSAADAEKLRALHRRVRALEDTTTAGLLLADVELLRDHIRVAMSDVSNGEMPSWGALNAAYESTEPGHARRDEAWHVAAVAEQETGRTMTDLIRMAEGYLDGGERLFAIEFAEGAIEALRGTVVAADLSAWLKTPEPHLDNELIERTLAALRVMA